MANNDKPLKIDNGFLDLPLQSIISHWPSHGTRDWKLSKDILEIHLLHYNPDREGAFLKVLRANNTVQYGFVTAQYTDINFLPLDPDDPRQADIEAFIRDYKRRF